MVARYALMIVFEYNQSPENINAPNPLLAMYKDLNSAWDLAVNRFHIPRKNITVLTDIKSDKSYPWDPMRCDDCNPKIHRIKHPDIKIIIREIAQFMENTIRDVPECLKGDKEVNELFVYISGHGSSIPNFKEGNDNALMFTCKKGITRKYLRDENIFQLLFGHIPIDNGSMIVPITGVEYRISNTGNRYAHYFLEKIEIKITHVNNRLDRGMPYDNHMLMIIDTCNSGEIPKFQYVYDNKNQKMKYLDNSTRDIFPRCVCLSATQTNSVVPSSLIGSPFTNYITKILHDNNGSITIEEMHNLIYKNLPSMLVLSQPTITSTSSSEKTILPLSVPNKHLVYIGCQCKLCGNKDNCDCHF